MVWGLDWRAWVSTEDAKGRCRGGTLPLPLSSHPFPQFIPPGSSPLPPSLCTFHSPLSSFLFPSPPPSTVPGR